MAKNGLSFWRQKKNLAKIEKWAETLGMKKLAERMGISRSTLYSWIEKDSDISDTIARAHTRRNYCVEDAFYQNCVGFSRTVPKNYKLKRTIFDEKGRKVREEEYIEKVQEEIYYRPDVNAQKFYLANAMPEKWGNAVIGTLDDDKSTGVVALPAVAEVIEEDGEAAEK